MAVAAMDELALSVADKPCPVGTPIGVAFMVMLTGTDELGNDNSLGITPLVVCDTATEDIPVDQLLP